MASPPPRLFVFGLGFSAARAAMAFHARKFQVAGTCRGEEGVQALRKQAPDVFHDGKEDTPRNVFLFDGSTWDATKNDGISLREALVGVTHMIVSVPTSGQGDIVLTALRDELLDAVQPTLQWLAYLSTIGVYGETKGEAVEETAPVGSTVPRNQARILAEQQWLETGLPCHIFRLAGIYGAGRGPLVRVRADAAKRIDLPGRVFNRIYVDDIVNVLLASADRPSPGAIYNVSDDEPAPAEQVTAYACELLEKDVPPLVPWEVAEQSMSAMAKSFYVESKVVSNRKIRKELGVVLRYPTYREGLLAQVLEEEHDTKSRDEESDLNVTRFPPESTLIILVNNGSLRVEPFLELRRISFRLSRWVQSVVVPCSFRFSDRIDPTFLHGLRAQTLADVLKAMLKRESHIKDIIVLPLILGNNVIVQETTCKILNQVLGPVSSPSSNVTVHVGSSLVDLSKPADDRIARILAEKVRNTLVGIEKPSAVFVVEHGSPSADVHAATDLVTTQLRKLLPHETVSRVDNVCMERREGPEYDFNGPLLRDAVDFFDIQSGVVVFALLFLSCGRHAGPGGDIESIAAQVRLKHPHLDIRITDPIGANPALTEILEDRLMDASEAVPTQVVAPTDTANPSLSSDAI